MALRLCQQVRGAVCNGVPQAVSPGLYCQDPALPRALLLQVKVPRQTLGGESKSLQRPPIPMHPRARSLPHPSLAASLTSAPEAMNVQDVQDISKKVLFRHPCAHNLPLLLSVPPPFPHTRRETHCITAHTPPPQTPTHLHVRAHSQEGNQTRGGRGGELPRPCYVTAFNVTAPGNGIDLLPKRDRNRPAPTPLTRRAKGQWKAQVWGGGGGPA